MPFTLEFSRFSSNARAFILRRIASLREEQGLSDLKEAVATSVRDPVEQGELVAKIEDMLRATLAESDQLEQSAARVDEARERSVRLQLEVAERKAATRRSWLERESVISMIGAILLLALGIALIVAMFYRNNTARDRYDRTVVYPWILRPNN